MISTHQSKNRFKISFAVLLVSTVALFAAGVQKAEAIIGYALTTNAASSVTATSATLNGNILIINTGYTTEHGFAYGTEPTLTTSVIATTTLGVQFLVGAFSETISSLTCETTYYFRAYGINLSNEHKEGVILNFTTGACEIGGRGTLFNNGMTGGSSSSVIAGPPNVIYVDGFPVIVASGTVATTTTTLTLTATSSLVATSTSTSTVTVATTSDATSTPVISACPEGYKCVPIIFIPTTSNLVTAVPLPVPATFLKDLTLGQNDTDVMKLQQFLNNHGFTVSSQGAGSPGAETVFFGPATRAALIKFQQTYNIEPAIGFFGPITRGVVNNLK